jgi:hypothetical protein
VLKRAAAALAVSSLVLLGAQIAGAGDVTQKDRAGEVSAKGLTKAERDAIDIVSLRVVGQEGLGVFVTATFKGSFEKLFGRGHLKNAVAVMVLHPKPGKGEPAGIVTQGAGKTEQDLRVSRSELVATVRKGRELTFALAGGGFSNVDRVEVKVITDETSSSARTTAQASPPPTVSATRWRKLLKTAGRDAAVATALAADLSCDELQDLRKAIERRIATVNTLRPINQTRLTNFTSFRAGVDVLIGQRCGQTPTAAVTGAEFTWRPFSSREVAGSGRFKGRAGTQINAIRVILPPDGSTQRVITNFLCPSQFRAVTVNLNEIVCQDGTLVVDEPFNMNLQVNPPPVPGMGGQLFARVGSTSHGPFPMNGP